MSRQTSRHSLIAGLMVALLCLALAGCGYNRGERAASGGLLGAGGGAAIAAVTVAIVAVISAATKRSDCCELREA